MFLESLIQSILICQLHQDARTINSGDVSITSNVLTCMSEATNRDFGLIIISLSVNHSLMRKATIELCHCLKTHSTTKKTPIVVSVDCIHRGIAVNLADAGVRFMDLRKPGAPIDPESLMELVHLGDPSIKINRILNRLCPWIHYNSIDDHCELTTCRAYRNRMILGGRRLHKVCETDDHIYCEYFLFPRLNS